MITLADLDGLTVIGEYATLQAEVSARKKDLHNEWGIKPFDSTAQTEWASLTEVDAELTRRITEYNARVTDLEAKTRQPDAIVGPFKPAEPPGRAQHARRVPEDIFAIDEYHKLSNSPEERLQALRDGAMFAVERAFYPHPSSVPATEQAHIQRLLDVADLPSKQNPNRELAQRILATGTPVYLRAFTKYLRDGNTDRFTQDEQRAVAPWTVQTDATGGFAVPFYFDPTLLHTGAWTITNPFRGLCAVKTIVGTDTFNGASTTAFTVTRAAEQAASTEGLGAVAQITAIVAKVHGTGKFSIELLQDRPDVTSEIASLIAEAKDTEEENVFSVAIGGAVGAGFNPIGALATGSTAGAFTAVETAGSTVLAAADADLIEAGLPLRHRSNAIWMMSKAALRQWQALETTGGKLFGGVNYARVPNPNVRANGDTGLTLINYPVYEAPSGASGLVAQSVIGALFNPNSYYIIERAGMSVEVIPHFLDATTGYPTGERMIYAWWRNTAKPADVNAGRRLRIKT
jgi:HK97 family phage major capsid protein